VYCNLVSGTISYPRERKLSSVRFCTRRAEEDNQLDRLPKTGGTRSDTGKHFNFVDIRGGFRAGYNGWEDSLN